VVSISVREKTKNILNEGRISCRNSCKRLGSLKTHRWKFVKELTMSLLSAIPERWAIFESAYAFQSTLLACS
jgi:hypothetical protein